MPCGPQLIEDVASVLHVQNGKTPALIQKHLPAAYTRRAIRYALAALIKSGRAKRRGEQGPVFAVANDE